MALQRVGHNWVHTRTSQGPGWEGRPGGWGKWCEIVDKSLGYQGGLFSVNWCGQMALNLPDPAKGRPFSLLNFRTSDSLLSANTKSFLASGSKFSVSEDQNLQKAWPWPLHIPGSRTALVSGHFILFKKNDLFSELKTFHKINAYKEVSINRWMDEKDVVYIDTRWNITQS